MATGSAASSTRRGSARSIRVPFVIARTEFRRTLRVVAGDRTKALVLAAIAVFALGPISLGGWLLLSTAGEEVAAGSVEAFGLVTALDLVTGISALAWLFIALMATMRTTTAIADLDEPACLLLSTSVRNVVVGQIGAELARFAVWLIVPTLVLSSAFASGAGTLLPVLVAPLFVALVLVSALSVGFVLGVWVRHLLTVYEPIAQYRTHFVVLLSVAYFGSIAMGWFDTITGMLFNVLGESPLGWPGHLLLLSVPNVAPSTGAVVGAVVATALVVPLAVGAGIVSARIHWVADPARSDDDSAAETHSSDRLAAVLSRGLEAPIRTVTVTTIRRTKRAPVRLLYVAYPLFGTFFFVDEIARVGTVPSYMVVLLSLYVVWGAGALFTLNPLGDLGRALPAVMTSSISGRTTVFGQIVAGALVAVPFGILVPLVAGVVSPLSLEHTAILVVATVLGAVASPALATGVGSAFPRFGSVRITNNREAVMPSKTAFLVYSLAILFPAAAAAVVYTDAAPDLIATILSFLVSLVPGLDVSITIPAMAITAAAWIVLVAGLIAPLASARYAVTRFDGYTLE